MNNKGRCDRDFPIPAVTGQSFADPDCEGDEE